MRYEEKQKILTAKRLKTERENKGLSHEGLARALNQVYGNGEKIISAGVLKNYEVDEPYHSKFSTGYGMNVKYLVMFADYYGVSTDYLMGLTSIKSPDKTTQAICEATGLSEGAVLALVEMKGNVILDNYDEKYKTLSELIENDDFMEAVEKIHELKFSTLERRIDHAPNPAGIISESTAEIINDPYIYSGIRWEIEDKLNKSIDNILKINEGKVSHIKVPKSK